MNENKIYLSFNFYIYTWLSFMSSHNDSPVAVLNYYVELCFKNRINPLLIARLVLAIKYFLPEWN